MVKICDIVEDQQIYDADATPRVYYLIISLKMANWLLRYAKDKYDN